MTLEEAKSLCTDPRARKGQLREALCLMCGVPYRPMDYTPADSLVTECLESFMQAIRQRTGTSYHYCPYERRPLVSIIRKVSELEPGADDARVLANFTYIVRNLPEWYITHNYRISTIDKCFDIILSNIRKNNNGKPVSDDYKQRIAEELLR